MNDSRLGHALHVLLLIHTCLVLVFTHLSTYWPEDTSLDTLVSFQFVLHRMQKELLICHTVHRSFM